MKRSLAVAAAVLLVALNSAGVAQHEHHAARATEALGTSTLSAEAVQQLLNGEGMGLARAAELNGYPGPKHVLELKEPLEVTPAQESKIEAVRQQMLEAARRIGRSIVAEERALDAAFQSGTITEAELARRTAAIAGLQGQLRRAHLQAHLLTKPLLSRDQAVRYTELRRAHH